MGVIALAQFTITDFNDITPSTTAPSSPSVDQLWLDTSVSPNQLKRWTGTAWVVVNDVKIGGKNLILNSKPTNPIVTTSYLVQSYTISEDFITGQDYTFVIKGTVANGQKFGVWMNSGSSGMGYATTTYVNGVTYVTFKAIATTTGNERKLSLYNNPSGSTSSTVEWVALYKGNQPMDWSPAPEDTQGQIGGITTRLTTAEGSINTQADQIALSVKKTDIETYKNNIIKVRYIRDYLNGNTTNTGNHWVEIKAMQGITNVASGKTTTCSDGTTTNIARVTDGSIPTGYFQSTTSGSSQYVKIDLGATYDNIDYLQIWHYSDDGRTYHGTKTEVSVDGTNWTTLFDSSISGEYAETPNGHVVNVNFGSVVNRITNAESSITTQADKIALVVKSDNTIDGSALVSSINLQPNSVKIQAKNVDITGAVTFSSLDPSVAYAMQGVEFIDNTVDTLIHFDGNLCATNGVNPNSDYIATLRPLEGKYGDCVAVEEGTTNLVALAKQNFSGWSSYSGAVTTLTQNQTVYEWGTDNATRIQTSGGTSTLKYYINIVSPSVNGTSYALSVKVKNIGTTAVIIDNNLGQTVAVNPNEIKLVTMVGLGNGTLNVQFQFKTNAVADSLDLVVYQPQVEQKAFCTSFTTGTRAYGVLNYGTASNYLSTSKHSVFMWAKPSEFTSAYNMFFAISSSFYMGFNGSSMFRVSVRDSANAQKVNGYTSAFAINTWYFIGYTFDNGTLKMYVNGDLVKTVAGLTSTVSFSGSTGLTIGSYYNSTYVSNGLTDEVFLSKRVLTDSQVKAIYNLGKPMVDQTPKIIVPKPSTVTITLL